MGCSPPIFPTLWNFTNIFKAVRKEDMLHWVHQLKYCQPHAFNIPETGLKSDDISLKITRSKPLRFFFAYWIFNFKAFLLNHEELAFFLRKRMLIFSGNHRISKDLKGPPCPTLPAQILDVLFPGCSNITPGTGTLRKKNLLTLCELAILIWEVKYLDKCLLLPL